MALGSLSGFRIAVTADRRHEEQASLIERRGGAVLHGPVIRTLPLGEEGGTRRAIEALIDRPPDVVVLSTALGVRGWFSAAAGMGMESDLVDSLRHAEIVARGTKAIGAAVAADLGPTLPLPSPTYEAIADAFSRRPAAHVDGRAVRVAVQLDGDGSAGLHDRLAALGFEVVAVPVYRWVMPEDLRPAERLVAAVAERRVDAVTFTSAHSVTNFERIVAGLGRAEEVRSACRSAVATVCVGPVTRARAASAGLQPVVEPTQPRLGAMVAAMAVAFDRRALHLHHDSHRIRVQGNVVVVGDDAVVLTDRERSVLEILFERQGGVVSKQQLLQRVWRDDSDEHVVEVTVGRLRRRLGPAGSTIETVVRRGYRLAAS